MLKNCWYLYATAKKSNSLVTRHVSSLDVRECGPCDDSAVLPKSEQLRSQKDHSHQVICQSVMNVLTANR
jgi:hypothetical protein